MQNVFWSCVLRAFIPSVTQGNFGILQCKCLFGRCNSVLHDLSHCSNCHPLKNMLVTVEDYWGEPEPSQVGDACEQY